MKTLENKQSSTPNVNLIAIIIAFSYPLINFVLSFFYDTTSLSFNIYYFIYSILYLIPIFVLWLINCKNKKDYFPPLYKRPEIIVLLAFLLWATISCFFSTRPSISFLGINKERTLMEEGLIQYYTYACIFFYAYHLKEEKLITKILKLFVILTFIIAVLAFIDPYGKIFPAFFNTYPYSAMFVNSNHYGYFLCLAILISCGLAIFEKSLWQKILFSVNFLILTVQLLLNGSFGPCLAVCATLFILPFAFRFFMGIWNQLTFIPIAIFLILASFIHNANFYKDLSLTVQQLLGITLNTSTSANTNIDSYGTERIGLWKHSLKLIGENPLFGIGLGNFTYKGKQNRPHNEYLQHFVSTGIIGGLLYIIALAIIFIRAIKNRRNTSPHSFILGGAVFCYLISAFFGNTMSHVMPFFVTFLAMFVYSIKPIEKIK